jgi:hypothetical protein
MKKQKQFIGHKWWIKREKLRKHKKLFHGKATKEDLIMLVESLVKNLSALTIKVKKLDYYRSSLKRTVWIENIVKKYPNIHVSFKGKSRKHLTGIYGSLVHLARKEKLI